MKKVSNPASILTVLISVNIKRFESYKSATDHIKDINGKLLFMNYAVQSQEFIARLNKWLATYGTSFYSGQGNSKLLRSWTGFKNILMLRRTRILLDHCEGAERESLKAYRFALTEDVLPAATVIELKNQVSELEEAYKKMRLLKSRNLQLL